MAKRYELSDEAWNVVEDLFTSTHTRGRPRSSDRLMLDGMLWLLRSGAPWWDMSEYFGPGERFIIASGSGEIGEPSTISWGCRSMLRFSESTSEKNHFIFFDDYEDEDFEEFVSVVLRVLSVKEEFREYGPYSVLVMICYKGIHLFLTSGSFEGCFISMDKKVSYFSSEIIEKFTTT